MMRLDVVPDEIIYTILEYVTASDIAALRQATTCLKV
jgi:hypothetical protein